MWGVEFRVLGFKGLGLLPWKPNQWVAARGLKLEVTRTRVYSKQWSLHVMNLDYKIPECRT